MSWPLAPLTTHTHTVRQLCFIWVSLIFVIPVGVCLRAHVCVCVHASVHVYHLSRSWVLSLLSISPCWLGLSPSDFIRCPPASWDADVFCSHSWVVKHFKRATILSHCLMKEEYRVSQLVKLWKQALGSENSCTKRKPVPSACHSG